MKITFILPVLTFHGGIRSTVLLAKALYDRGHDVTIYSQPQRPPSFKEQLKNIIKGKGLLPHIKYPPSHIDNVDIPHKVIDHYNAFEDKDLPDADIVVATWWENAESMINFSESKGVKVYFVRHHEVHDNLPKERSALTYRMPYHKITTAQWLVDVMREEYGDENVSVVPNSIDLELFQAPPRGKQPVPTIGMMYSRIPWKGCDIALKAFSIASKVIPNLRLLTFGKDEPSEDLALPSNSRYYFRPTQTQIRDTYTECDAWLFSSRNEGFGLPILEAMACRTPVIGTPAGIAPEFLKNGAGFLVRPEDPEDMANAIISIAKMSEEEWKKMSDIGHQKVTSYTWNDAAELCEEAFQVAIERRKKGEIA
jgi:glycosyltransferase involved in cell wall biosynthesis